jgi:hypothetical protein
MRINVHVDGCDLDCGCLEGTPYQRIDVAALCARLLPEDEIKRVRYREPLRVVREDLDLTRGVIERAAATSSGHDLEVVVRGVRAHEQQSDVA